jgi:hypothetical protein
LCIPIEINQPWDDWEEEFVSLDIIILSYTCKKVIFL